MAGFENTHETIIDQKTFDIEQHIDGRKVQRINIVWNCIGEFTSPVITEIEKST